jgi:hypothetical protein
VKNKEDKQSKKIAADYKKAVKALQKALDKVGKRLGGRAGIMVSTRQIAIKDDMDLYNVLDDLLKQVKKIGPNAGTLFLAGDCVKYTLPIRIPPAPPDSPRSSVSLAGFAVRAFGMISPPY